MKNGRPKKESDQVRDIVKQVRYSTQEWAEVQDKLDVSKLSYSDFVRKASLRAKITPVNMEAIKALRDTEIQLARIGNNLNIIARNSTEFLGGVSFEAFNEDLQKIVKIAKAVSAELLNIRRGIQ